MWCWGTRHAENYHLFGTTEHSEEIKDILEWLGKVETAAMNIMSTKEVIARNQEVLKKKRGGAQKGRSQHVPEK